MLWKVSQIMPLLPNSITTRTSVLLALLVTIVFAVMGLVIQASVNQHFADQDKAAIAGKLELISNSLRSQEPTKDLAKTQQQLERAFIGHHDMVVRVQSLSGQDIFAAGHDQLPDDLLKNATTTLVIQPWQTSAATYRLVVTDVVDANGVARWRVAIAIDTMHHDSFLVVFDRQLRFIGVAGLILLALLGWLVIRRGLAPLEKMAKVAEGISAQRIDARLSTEAVPKELESMVRAFNAMLDRLKDSLQRLSAFSSDLAHELRTPVNNVMTQTQVLLSKPRNDDDYREVLYSNLEEFERLARMISDMLFLAKADNGLLIPHREKVKLHEEVSAVIDFYEALAADKSVHIEAHGEVTVIGDALMLRRVISNLLSNAVRHADSGSTVQVNMAVIAGQGSLVVENEGGGIAPEHLPHLFDRFYRVDSARQRVDEGVGLGLAITRSIVLAHQGDISVNSGEGRTRFSLKLPAANFAE